jgi:LacI family transcriptional regulator
VFAISDAGLNVPKDVSVVGFDDMPEVGENLTTIRQDIPLLAASTVELVQEAFGRKEPRHIEIPVQLIVRGTTARKRG